MSEGSSKSERVSDNSPIEKRSSEGVDSKGMVVEIDPKYQPDVHNALTVSGAVLTIISTIVGGGIVGLPYGFYNLGIYLGCAIMIGVGFQQANAAWLYLCTKDLVAGKPESIFEIGYMLFKRKSIFFISVILAMNAFGLVMVYFIVFSKIMASMCTDSFDVTEDDDSFKHWLVTKQFWVLILAAAMLPVCLKKELQELHWVSVSLFTAILIFIFGVAL